ncbi:uncharacterized protein LOC127858338 isoform X2 [Dreissena polymorpha]|uniref:Uncharacterized protein n=1 Tax=Dreissena polymorpha TaxID=45954 RepID=A0A9D4H9U5_DREPO|nr:uncharacterized protein LOC127858338 isoform X2 [Dreissena polymorpha]KAH3712961.1 hypothetical protein DPMN_072723 [Dreissena polymorpha]
MAGYKDIANDRSTSQGPLLRYINATVVNSSSVNYGPTTESVLPVASNDKAQDVVAFGAIALIIVMPKNLRPMTIQPQRSSNCSS